MGECGSPGVPKNPRNGSGRVRDTKIRGDGPPPLRVVDHSPGFSHERRPRFAGRVAAPCRADRAECHAGPVLPRDRRRPRHRRPILGHLDSTADRGRVAAAMPVGADGAGHQTAAMASSLSAVRHRGRRAAVGGGHRLVVSRETSRILTAECHWRGASLASGLVDSGSKSSFIERHGTKTLAAQSRRQWHPPSVA